MAEEKGKMAEEKVEVKKADEEMQKKNQDLPQGEMSPEVKEKWDLMTKQLHSWVDPNLLKTVIEVKRKGKEEEKEETREFI